MFKKLFIEGRNTKRAKDFLNTLRFYKVKGFTLDLVENIFDSGKFDVEYFDRVVRGSGWYDISLTDLNNFISILRREEPNIKIVND